MKENEINISNFFETNSRLFVVIGVFSALAVYFTNFLSMPGNQEKTTIHLFTGISFNPLEYVILACFIIVVLIIFALLKQITYSEKDGFFPIYYLIGFEAAKRIILIISLILIAFGIISTILLVYAPLIFPFALLLAFIFGFITFFTIVILWMKYYQKYTHNDPRGCVSILLFSIIMIIMLGILDNIALSIEIKELSILLIVYLGIIGSGAGIFLLFSIIFCLLRLFKILMKKTG